MLFKNVEAATDVRYLGAVRVSGKTPIRSPSPAHSSIHPNTIPGMSKKEEVDDTEFAVVIDDAGRPRSDLEAGEVACR